MFGQSSVFANYFSSKTANQKNLSTGCLFIGGKYAMSKVVLISAPLLLEERYSEFSGAGNTQPTFALVCLAAIAIQKGWDVKIIDASALGRSVQETKDEILEFEPDVVGMTTTTVGISATADLASIIKQQRPEIITVIGGCHITAIPEDTMKEFPSFDIGVIGEGELTFAEILDTINKSDRIPPRIAGTIVRLNDQIIKNSPRELINDLDQLPLPAWHLLTGFPKDFSPSPARIKRYPCASVVFTRGCPNQCQFCDRSVFGKRIRSVSSIRAVEIIKDLTNNYGVKEILIEDDTFIVSKKRITEFCEKIIEEKINISWSCLGRADRVDPEILRLMKKAGCWHISYGIESGDQVILDAMKKNEDLAQIQQAVSWTHEAGIRSKGFFIVGFPGETHESLNKTQQLILDLQLDDISVMQLTPFPGTAIYDEADKWGSFEKNWKRMNIINTVFIPNGLTENDLIEARNKMLRTFYFRPRIIFGILINIRNLYQFTHLFGGFITMLKILTKKWFK